jgi:multiple sugar transport system ATP-binding protein
MATVSLDHVVKRFGTFTAVHDLSLDIADREFLVLLEPSGCGKTTTMRMYDRRPI